MTLNEYQKLARSYRLKSATAFYAALNLSGEVGELHSLFAKAERDGRKEDFLVNVEKELGDILWHVAAIADDYGLKLDRIGITNIEKLDSRKYRNVLQGSGDDR